MTTRKKKTKAPRKTSSKPQKAQKGGKGGKSFPVPVSRFRRLTRITTALAAAATLALSIVGDFYVHHSPEWLAERRSPLTLPL